MTKRPTVHLGFEVGSGEPVQIPLHHLAVTGQTQLAGKTTTIEALIARSGLRAVVFITKRAEGGFGHARRIQPYFKERSDWQFVASLLEATMREKMKFQRSWIIRVCRNTRSLSDVRRNVAAALENKKTRNLDRSVYEELAAYLDLVLPQIEKLPYTSELRLEPGINAMDLTDYKTELQALVIRSVLEWIYENEHDTVAIIPEAWEFIPEKRGSPVLLAAETLIRKGAAARNYVWLDSQDIAGVNKAVLKSVGVWILGVQMEHNEVKRTLNHTNAANKPKPSAVMRLGLGEFFVCHGKVMREVYAQPAWASEDQARKVAMGYLGVGELIDQHLADIRARQRREGDDVTWKAELEKERREHEGTKSSLTEARGRIQELESLVYDLQRQVGDLVQADTEPQPKAPVDAPTGIPQTPPDVVSLAEAVAQHLNMNPGMLSLAVDKPEIEVTVRRPTVEVDTGSPKGCVALLISRGFFDQPHNPNQALKELGNIGFPNGPKQIYDACADLCKLGFLVKSRNSKGVTYTAVPDMKVRVVEG